MTKALLVTDLQNDYLPEGAYPLWNSHAALKSVAHAIERARAQGVSIIIQHAADSNAGIAPFFNGGALGGEEHPRVLAAAPDAPIVTKDFADSFVDTTPEEELSRLRASA